MTDSPKRIAIVVSTFPPYRGGMGNVAADHAEALSEAGHDVDVLVPRMPSTVARPNIRVRHLRSLFRYGNAAVLPQLAWKLRGYDIVELHYPFFGGAEYVLLWKRLFGKDAKLVVVYHMDVIGKGVARLVFRLYRKLFLDRLMRAADRIVATSRDYLEYSLVRHVASDGRVRVVPLAVDTERFRPVLARERKTAIFVGGLDRAHYFKGVEVLLRAFRRVVREAPETELLIVGGGDLQEGYEKTARELGIAESVRFSGRLSDSDLPNAFRASAMVVLPSLDRSEAFGLVLLEGAASGLPAIASDLPGVRSVVRKGETGLLVPPGNTEALSDAMLELYRNPEKADRMGFRARSVAEEAYSLDVVHRALVVAITD